MQALVGIEISCILLSRKVSQDRLHQPGHEHDHDSKFTLQGHFEIPDAGDWQEKNVDVKH